MAARKGPLTPLQAIRLAEQKAEMALRALENVAAQMERHVMAAEYRNEQLTKLLYASSQDLLAEHITRMAAERAESEGPRTYDAPTRHTVGDRPTASRSMDYATGLADTQRRACGRDA